MTEFSGLWTTDASTPEGDQQTSYTQAQLSTCFDILACCSRFEGVAPTYLNELAPSDGGANTCDIASGAAIVDGKYYDNSATINVNIPSAVGGGNTRIDRVVVRCTWASYTARVYRIAGTDAASPTVPSITQNPGSTYDIKIAQVLVDTAGSLTVTDERDWAMPDVDNSTIEHSTGTLRVKDSGIVAAKIGTGAVTETKLGAGAVTETKIATGAVTVNKIGTAAVTETKLGTSAVTNTKLGPDCVNGIKIMDNAIDSEHYTDGSIDTEHLSNNCVDDTKVGNRVPQFYRRQGGSSTNWTTGGSTSYTPTAVRMQAGARTMSIDSGQQEDIEAVTFPTAFSYAPIVIAGIMDDAIGANDVGMIASAEDITTTGFNLTLHTADGVNRTSSKWADVAWLAIGPE